ncbi:sensor histidine kinase [Winogradskyella flava]|uniref:histidine kinase n=1 Tax=Winogradskyella flava TaxID=1884876 RepID=A0A842IQC6_9FLAO|nr:two-component regulator propeller domain-containing protein [Winogradskyella flava]MBC2845412.1 hypothetical protein [Winogradskyella flava]
MSKPLLISLLITCFGFSQNNIKHYTTADGLPHDVTYGLFQDSKGYIWIGTDNGLSKFNGQSFKNFTIDDGLRTNYVIDITEDGSENIALATWGGGLHFIKNDSVILPRINNDSIDKIHTVYTHKNYIISPSISGNLLYEKKSSFKFLKSTLLSDVEKKEMFKTDSTEINNGYVSELDSILVLTNHTLTNPNDTFFKGIYQLNDSLKLKPIFTFLDDKVISSIEKIDNDLYIASQKDSVYIFNTHKILNKQKLCIDNPFIVKIKRTKAQEYLVLTSDNKGFKNVHLFSSNFDHKINFKKLLNIKSTISNVLEDNEGNIWISTYGDGLLCVERTSSKINKFDNNLLNELLVKGITELEDDVYILTPNYITKINTSKNEVYRLKGIGKSILKQNKSIVVNSLYHEDALNENIFKHIIAYKTFSVDSIGIMHYGDSLRIPKLKMSVSADKKTIYDATFYKDTLWLATNLGAFYFNLESKRLIKKDILNKKLLGNKITKFLKTKDTLWVGTNKGLSIIANSEIKHFTKKNGLVNNSINTLFKDHRNHLWIGTQQGISVYNNNSFLNISQKNALASPFVDVIFEDKTYKIWIGGNKGISLIDNTNELQLKSPPIINISKDALIFNYDIISYNRSNDLLCEYKLDDNWINLTSPNGYLDFNNYKKGKYQLQFRAKKQDGKWGYSKIYNFQIKLPWYKEWYFGSLIIFIVLGLIVVSTINQLKKSKQKNTSLKRAFDTQVKLEQELSRVRDAIAQDFHDDLGNKLARISLLSNLVSGEASINDSKIKSKIKQITQDSNELYDGTRDFIFSLKANSDYLEELATYLSDFGEDYYSKTKIKFVLVNDIKSNIKLPYYWSKQLIYIFKEAMTNAMKYSKCNKVTMQFQLTHNELIIECKDDGIGISEKDFTSKNGLLNMKVRAEKIGGRLKIESDNNGTVIYFIGKTTS